MSNPVIFTLAYLILGYTTALLLTHASKTRMNIVAFFLIVILWWFFGLAWFINPEKLKGNK